MEHGELLHIDPAEGEWLRSRRPAEATAELLAGAYHALGDPTRLTLALALHGDRELCVCDLSWIVQRSQNLVSHHMKVLKARGIVNSRKQGKMTMYSLTPRGDALLAEATATLPASP
jgi:ArsR family transcriptional regulator, lead/cadmium/zinc/bismuth-responsive transcriptional repressor